MYKIEFAKTFSKDFKKIPQEVRNVVFKKWIPRLQENPNIGERFVGKRLKHYLRLPFRFKRNDYRIVYQIHQNTIVVVLLAIGSRENFYRRL